jgi:hypothetical protein
VQSTGDGIFALFGAPVAHEDHPQRALYAALAIRDALRHSGEELKQPGQPAVEVRIGINTGEVVLRMVHTGGHTEYTPGGSCGQPRGADADRGADGRHRNQRGYAASGRGLLRTARPRAD